METFIGDIELFAFDYAPSGWLLCNGTLLTIQQYQPLYALLFTNFGGDGKTTFAVPNLIQASPLPNAKYYIATQGLWPPRP